MWTTVPQLLWQRALPTPVLGTAEHHIHDVSLACDVCGSDPLALKIATSFHYSPASLEAVVSIFMVLFPCLFPRSWFFTAP